MAILWTHPNKLNVLLVLRTPELDTVLQIGSHKSRVEWLSHLPWPADHASLDAAQVTAGLLSCKCTLPACVEFMLNLSMTSTLKSFSGLCSSHYSVLPNLYLHLGLLQLKCRTAYDSMRFIFLIISFCSLYLADELSNSLQT